VKQKKETQEKSWVSFFVSLVGCLLHNDNVRRLQAFRPLSYFKLHLVAFVKDFEAVPFDSGEVNKDIISVVLGNETEALLLIKPFHTTFGHYNSPPFPYELK
jgi:hypothetical protein